MAFSIFNFVLPVYADSLKDAEKHLQKGQTQQALAKVDDFLATNPKDASGRFLRGVILTETNRDGEAIATFTKLTEDYPNLPEPYNNLAVIYAQLKQYDKAKNALEAAIRINPVYVTAHENLGDIYARLASQAYEKALQLDTANTTALTKLSVVRKLFTTSSRTSLPSAIATSTPVATVIPTTAAPAVSVQPMTAIDATTVKMSEPSVQDISHSRGTSADAEKMVLDWADAWSRKDFKAYISCYASNFKTPGGQSRASWENERKRRVTKPGKINVTIENMRVATDDQENVVVEFNQLYKSSTLSSSDRKSLLMTKENGQWKILQERVVD